MATQAPPPKPSPEKVKEAQEIIRQATSGPPFTPSPTTPPKK